MQLADAIADAVGGRSEILYPQPQFPFPEKPVPPAPALLIDDCPVTPADGVILTPVEVCDAVVAAGFTGDAAALLKTLEAVQEQMFGG